MSDGLCVKMTIFGHVARTCNDDDRHQTQVIMGLFNIHRVAGTLHSSNEISAYISGLNIQFGSP